MLSKEQLLYRQEQGRQYRRDNPYDPDIENLPLPHVSMFDQDDVRHRLQQERNRQRANRHKSK